MTSSYFDTEIKTSFRLAPLLIRIRNAESRIRSLKHNFIVCLLFHTYRRNTQLYIMYPQKKLHDYEKTENKIKTNSTDSHGNARALSPTHLQLHLVRSDTSIHIPPVYSFLYIYFLCIVTT